MKPWTVKTISGAAGGTSRQATVNLQINTEADTVEEVRRAVEALPDLLKMNANLLEALKELDRAIRDLCLAGQYEVYSQLATTISVAREQVRAALVLAGGDK